MGRGTSVERQSYDSQSTRVTLMQQWPHLENLAHPRGLKDCVRSVKLCLSRCLTMLIRTIPGSPINVHVEFEAAPTSDRPRPLASRPQLTRYSHRLGGGRAQPALVSFTPSRRLSLAFSPTLRVCARMPHGWGFLTSSYQLLIHG